MLAEEPHNHWADILLTRGELKLCSGILHLMYNPAVKVNFAYYGIIIAHLVFVLLQITPQEGLSTLYNHTVVIVVVPAVVSSI